MELLLYFLFTFSLLSNINCRFVDVVPKTLGKKLFLSRRIVTDTAEFDGGVLVSEEGIIEAVLKRDVVNSILAKNLNDFKIIDGGDLALMAGVVDSHVHVNEPGRTSWEGYSTATQAAAAGGVTTIIDMPLNTIPPTTTLENLKVKAAYARGDVFVDVGFWGGVVPGNQIELHDLIRAGVVGFKCFLTESGVPEFPMVTGNDLTKAFTVLNGTGTVLAFHAEMSLGNNTAKCSGSDCPDPILYSTYLASRPDEMEMKAVSLITSFLPQTDVHVHVVHVSAEGVIPILEKARSDRIQAGYKGWRGGVTAETCNHYLTLNSEMIPPGHSEYKCSPPVRNITNKQKLWDYIKDRRLDLVVSDHSPSVANLKGPNFMTAWGGISSVQFDLSLFWTEAKARGLSLSEASHYLSAGPARLVGLQDRKGAIMAGLDADLIFFDPNASFVVTPDIIRYKNKISPYMYRVLTGRVERTYLRGRLIYGDGDLITSPQGKLLLNEEMQEMLSQSIEQLYKAIETEPGKSNTKEIKLIEGIDNLNFDLSDKVGQTKQGKQDSITRAEYRTTTPSIAVAMLPTSESNGFEETTLTTKLSNKNDILLPFKQSKAFVSNNSNDTENTDQAKITSKQEVVPSNNVNSLILNGNGDALLNEENNDVNIDLLNGAATANKNATPTRSLKSAVVESEKLKRIFFANNTTSNADFVRETVLIIFIIGFLIN